MRKFGYEIETLALQYLETHSFRLICRNFHCRQGEIDLIVLLDRTLVFVEVRFKKPGNYGSAEESVTTNKQKRLRHAAGVFLCRYPHFASYSCRFDVIAVTLKMRDYDIHWIPNAFQ